MTRGEGNTGRAERGVSVAKRDIDYVKFMIKLFCKRNLYGFEILNVNAIQLKAAHKRHSRATF